MATPAKWLEFEEFTARAVELDARAPMCGAVRAQPDGRDTMAVSFFGGQGGAGSRVWSASRIVKDQNNEQLLARVRELESLCTEVLVTGVDMALPQRLLNRLWGAVGHAELPHAYHIEL